MKQMKSAKAESPAGDKGPFGVRGFSPPVFFGMSGFFKHHRLSACLALSAVMAAISYTASFWLRFELSFADYSSMSWHSWWVRGLPFAMLTRMVASAVFQLHRCSWRHASTGDVPGIAGAAAASSAVMFLQVVVVWQGTFPLSIIALDAFLYAAMLLAARFSWRIGEDLLIRAGTDSRPRALIIGGGPAGCLTVRAMLTPGGLGFNPIGILDDDPFKAGSTINGVAVFGPIGIVEEVARRERADVVVLALPAIESRRLYGIARMVRRTGLPLKTIPNLQELRRDGETVTRLSDFRIEALLDRRPQSTSVPEVRELVQGRVIMVTGAAGSIGSELCRQIVEQDAAVLVCLDKDENGLFRIEQELRQRVRERGSGPDLRFFLCDIKDRSRMETAFGGNRPEVIFHAAAYKHVPVLQHHPIEAVRNNVGGTRLLAELADRHRVATFVLISTDKAVNPTSVMGATKRIAERIVRDCDRRSSTRFCTIRFGNVLGSNGSVLEIFRGQIERRDPVTVTHPDIERYFMTIPEAVSLVIFAASVGRGGEVFILDMGRPVKIDSLARNMIRLAGLEPDVDLPVVYSGLRPGEKLYEELWTESEKPVPSGHAGIMVAPGSEILTDRLDNEIIRMLNAAADNDLDGLWHGILELVPSFKGRTNGHAHLPPDIPLAETAHNTGK